jgi:hypothetical protein
MWWWKNRRSPSQSRREPSVTPALTGTTEEVAGVWVEAAAMLAGRSVELFHQRGEKVPRWAWLNAPAHRNLVELGELAHAAEGEELAQGPLVEAVVSAALLKQSGGERTAVFRLQRDCLIPLELELIAGRINVDEPGQLLHLALVALHTGRCPHSG